MNFLAHLYLSGDDVPLQIGNFIADFVKGRSALANYPKDIVRGIELHRQIDDFTDKHAIVTLSKNRLRPKYRHYAGVIVDVFYDHFLASQWSQFHSLPLDKFTKQVYETMTENLALLPSDVQYMLPYMIKENWLLNYSKEEGIHRALSGMSRRTPYESKMNEAIHDLIKDKELYLHEFSVFFPELKIFCEPIVKNHFQ